MHTPEKEARIRLSIDHIESLIRQIEFEAHHMVLGHDVAAGMRAAIDLAYDRHVLREGVRLRNRLKPEQKRWMRVLLIDRAVENPALQGRLRAVVEELRTNYGFEWLNCPLTALVQREARNIILSAAESEFGDTPMAGPLAYVRCHHRMYKIRDITNYDEVYLRAVALEQNRFFVDRGREWRAELRIKTPSASSVMAVLNAPAVQTGSSRS